jgi:hypothetical protein
MNVLMVDVGGTNVKVMARHDGEMRKVPSGKTLTASENGSRSSGAREGYGV